MANLRLDCSSILHQYILFSEYLRTTRHIDWYFCPLKTTKAPRPSKCTLSLFSALLLAVFWLRLPMPFQFKPVRCKNPHLAYLILGPRLIHGSHSGSPFSFLPIGTSLEGLKTITPVPININTETPVNTSGMFNGPGDASAKSTSSGLSVSRRQSIRSYLMKLLLTTRMYYKTHEQKQTPPSSYGPADSYAPGRP